MKKSIILSSIVLAIGLILLKYLEFNFYYGQLNKGLYIALITVFSIGVGVWYGREFFSKKVIEEKVLILQELPLQLDALERNGFSRREAEILVLLDKGLSNQGIAAELFISLSTVKSHVSSILSKLEVSNRVQAIRSAKLLISKADTKV